MSTLDKYISFHGGDRSQRGHDKPTGRRREIEVTELEYPHRTTGPFQPTHHAKHVFDVPSKAIELGDHEAFWLSGSLDGINHLAEFGTVNCTNLPADYV